MASWKDYDFSFGVYDKPPCNKDCIERRAGCHGECERYKAWEIKRKELVKKKNEDKDRQDVFDDYHAEQVKKSKKKAWGEK